MTTARPTPSATSNDPATGVAPPKGSPLRRPAFLVVAGVLLLCAVGLNAATSVMNLYFRKEALPLRDPKGLFALPLDLGPWVAVPTAQTFNADLVQQVGTDKFVFRTYVDTSQTGRGAHTREDVMALSGKPDADAIAHRWAADRPGSVVELAVTYYTGKVDTVPHVPERCMVAGGFTPVDPEVFEWTLGTTAAGGNRTVPVRFATYERFDRSQLLETRGVSYFFHVNGRYLADPVDVRTKLQDFTERYGYFAKIEVSVPTIFNPGVGNKERDALRETAKEQTRTFLTVALPQVEKLLPDWEAAHGRTPAAADRR